MTSPSRRAALLPLAVALFAVGVAGIVTVFVLAATAGAQALPAWLPTTSEVLAAAGFALGLVVLVQEARRS